MMASSDVSSLLHLLGASLAPQEAIRQEAEAQLEQASAASGFATLLLQVSTADSVGVEPSTRQAAAVYFKNLVSKRYDPYDESKVAPIDDGEKGTIRGMIISSIVSCPPTVRPQLIAATYKMIRADFPKKWPTLIDELYPLMTSGDDEKIISSLAVFHEIVSWHGGVGQDDVKQVVHGQMFSILLALLKDRMEGALVSLHKSGLAIVKSILKTFYAAIQFRFSTHIMGGDSFATWIDIFNAIISTPMPEELRSLVGDEASCHMFWKSKKWAFRIHNKIYQRYGCSKLDSFNNPDNMPFAKAYMEHCAMPLFSLYMAQIESNLKGTNPFTDRIFSLICDQLEAFTRHKKTWTALEAHAIDIISHFIFPRLCFSMEDFEMWENDPEEYVRVKLDPFDELSSPQSSGVSFVVDLCKARKKAMFMPVLQFINATLSDASLRASNCLSIVQVQEGALFLLGSLSKVLMASEVQGQLESVIHSFVLPQLSNKEGFLRMRACWVIEEFDDLTYSPEACVETLKSILSCLLDAHLPVRVAAASALGAIIDNEAAQKFMPEHLGKTIEILLQLANEIQLDSIAYVLERLVQLFADELAPFAAQLCLQLRDTVARHLEGYSNVLDVDASDDNFGMNADKMMAIVGMFKAIETLIDSMGKTPEIVAGLEEIVLPLIGMVLERRIIDVFEEAFELLDSITFTRKAISPALWALLPYIHKAFKDAGSDFIQDMQTTLDNIISYGSAQLVADAAALGLIVDIVETTMTSEDFGEHERTYGCKLIESLLLNCRGHLDGHLERFIRFVLPALSNREETSTYFIIHHLEVVVNALYYDAPATLRHLESCGGTALFFAVWFENIEKFTRVHDKRLIVMAIGQIFLTVPYSQLPMCVRENWPMILPVYLKAVQTLPKAIEARRKLQEEADAETSEYDDADSDADFVDEDDYDEVQDDNDGAEEISSSRLNKRSGGCTIGDDFSDFDSDGSFIDDEMEEELYFETPLDQIDVPSVVQKTLLTMAHSDGQSFQALTSALDAEHQQVLHSIISSSPSP